MLQAQTGFRFRLPAAVSADIGAGASTQHRDEVSLESRIERHHTDASLFNLLYEYLHEDGQVIVLSEAQQLDALRSGELVEMAGEYLGNPLEDVLAFLGTMYPYYEEHQKKQVEAAEAAAQEAKKAQRSGNPARRSEAQGAVEAADLVAAALQQTADSDAAFGIGLMLRMAEDLHDVPVHDLLLRTSSGLQAVLTVSSSYYSSQTNEYLRAGEFRVIGKVTRVVSGDNTLNLTRRTVLGAAKPAVAQDLIASTRSGDLQLDVADPIVAAPAVQILPMAIFL